ncbi:MAG: preprotein translocase subunit SecE [Sedimentisphaerales bacterium]|nr:preprotein translocase subunit SecE [Sedimentisphaerales bacterium]
MSWKIYKSGQGYYTRLISAITAGVVVALGCYQLWRKLGAIDFGSANTNVLVTTLVPLAVFSGFGWLIYWLVNKPVVADFMISAEGEMKKVSWSSRKEIIASTTVVIVVVIAMSSLMAATDVFFQIFFRAIGVLQ